MDNGKLISGQCPVGRALARAGDTWSMLILRDAGFGRSRFDDFQKSLGIAPNILTRRLAALVEAGLLERRQYEARPPRFEYLLTDCGRDYLPVLYALGAWGSRHFGDGEVTRLVDGDSGKPVDPVVVDRVTGRPLGEIALRTAAATSR